VVKLYCFIMDKIKFYKDASFTLSSCCIQLLPSTLFFPAGQARRRGYPAAGPEIWQAGEGACTCGQFYAKREEREVAAKSSELGLSLDEDALGHTKVRRSHLGERLCREAQPLVDEEREYEGLLWGVAAGLILPMNSWQFVAQWSRNGLLARPYSRCRVRTASRTPGPLGEESSSRR
jgi:hypothetical protein